MSKFIQAVALFFEEAEAVGFVVDRVKAFRVQGCGDLMMKIYIFCEECDRPIFFHCSTDIPKEMVAGFMRHYKGRAERL